MAQDRGDNRWFLYIVSLGLGVCSDTWELAILSYNGPFKSGTRNSFHFITFKAGMSCIWGHRLEHFMPHTCYFTPEASHLFICFKTELVWHWSKKSQYQNVVWDFISCSTVLSIQQVSHTHSGCGGKSTGRSRGTSWRCQSHCHPGRPRSQTTRHSRHGASWGWKSKEVIYDSVCGKELFSKMLQKPFTYEYLFLTLRTASGKLEQLTVNISTTNSKI